MKVNLRLSSPSVLPKAQRTRNVLLFWEECTNDSSSPFFCHSDSLSRTLKKRYTHKVKAKQPGQSEKGTTFVPPFLHKHLNQNFLNVPSSIDTLHQWCRRYSLNRPNDQQTSIADRCLTSHKQC